MTFAVSSTCELKNKTIKLFDTGPRKEECGRRVSVVGEQGMAYHELLELSFLSCPWALKKVFVKDGAY